VESVTCVDWSNSPHAINHVDIEHDLTQPLPLADGAFDTIIISSVIEHLPEPEAIWREMFRVLRPDGTVLLYVPFLYWLHEVPHDYYRYTEFALRRFAERSGFEVAELTPTGGALEVVTDVAAKTLARASWGRGIARFLQWACARVGGTRVGKRIARKTASLTPLAYAVVLRKPAALPATGPKPPRHRR
jgi:SAM-dependent methyltransferase